MAHASRAAARKPGKRSEFVETVIFLLKLVVIVAIVRSFVFSAFSIPSGSMLPRLLVGDYLFITKWNYGYSRHSLPFSLPLIPDRILAKTPERGDVVVLKAPPEDREDWIKRVIGLPGDTVQMRGGTLILNGQPVPKDRIADFIVPVSPNSPCAGPFLDKDASGAQFCRYPQFQETLPSGRSYRVLDQGLSPDADDTPVFTVPAGHVFLMGDNRDDSTDSRFEPQLAAFDGRHRGGLSFVPMENLQGRAAVVFWSTDGSAEWLLPWTWFSAARFERIGEGF
ncbi:signal peptidase I [Sphingomonas sp. CJ99]